MSEGSPETVEAAGAGAAGRRRAMWLAWVLLRVALLLALGATSSTFIYEQF